MEPLPSESKSNSEPFSYIEKIKEEDSELANVEEVQPLKLNPLITIATLSWTFAPCQASFIRLDLTKEDKNYILKLESCHALDMYWPSQRGAK